ncbi:MAG: NADH-quinone oxidoreductase subunit C [Polyangia bacterium]|jgi:NADH-quinone oxidoreductase subunit C
MNAQEIHAKLKAQFGDAVGDLAEAKIDPFVTVKPDKIVEVCRFAKAEAGLDFDYCEDITGIDWPARNLIEIVYHLFSLQHRHQIVLKVAADRGQPSVPSVQGVWKAANWLEREVYDMLGVSFAGHPDLRRILLPDDWVGHPLRKDYQEAGGYHGVSNTRFDPLVRLGEKVEEQRKAIVAATATTTTTTTATGTPPVPATAPAAASAPATVSAPAPVSAPATAPAKKETPSG